MNPWDIFAWSASIGLTVIVTVVAVAVLVGGIKAIGKNVKKGRS